MKASTVKTMQIGEPECNLHGEEQPKRVVRLSLNALPDAQAHLYIGEPYRLLRGSAVVREGQTDENGQIVFEVEEGASGLSVHVLGYCFELDLGPLPPASTQEGVKHRLQGLGYFADATCSERDDLTFALLRMEERLRLPLTGRSEPATNRLRGRFV
jgi:hypothetical protein